MIPSAVFSSVSEECSDGNGLVFQEFGLQDAGLDERGFVLYPLGAGFHLCSSRKSGISMAANRNGTMAAHAGLGSLRRIPSAMKLAVSAKEASSKE